MISETDKNFLNAPVAVRLRAVLNLLKSWTLGQSEIGAFLALSDEQSELLAATDTLADTLSQDQIERLGLLLVIHASLRVIFSAETRVYGWMKQSNTAFEGASAAEWDVKHGRAGLEDVANHLAVAASYQC